MNGRVITIELLSFSANLYRVTTVDLDHGNKPEGMEDFRGWEKAYEHAKWLSGQLGYPVRSLSRGRLSIPNQQ